MLAQRFSCSKKKKERERKEERKERKAGHWHVFASENCRSKAQKLFHFQENTTPDKKHI